MTRTPARDSLRRPVDLGGDFAALAEDGADVGECLLQDPGKEQNEAEGHAGEHRADVEQHGEREHGGEDAADEFDESGADEIAHAFDVVHDARDELAGFVGVVIRDREAADVLLHFAAEFGDEALGLLRQELGERERCDGLDGGGGEDDFDDRRELVSVVQVQDPEEFVSGEFVQHQIDERLGGQRKHEAGEAIDSDEDEAEEDEPGRRGRMSAHTWALTVGAEGLFWIGCGRATTVRGSGALGFRRH